MEFEKRNTTSLLRFGTSFLFVHVPFLSGEVQLESMQVSKERLQLLLLIYSTRNASVSKREGKGVKKLTNLLSLRRALLLLLQNKTRRKPIKALKLRTLANPHFQVPILPLKPIPPMQVLQIRKTRHQRQRERSNRGGMNVWKLLPCKLIQKGASFDDTKEVADELDRVEVWAGRHAFDEGFGDFKKVWLNEVDIENPMSER